MSQGIKNNNKKSGAKAEAKAQRREDAEERNAAYQSLPIDQKLGRQKMGGRAYNKLIQQKEGEI